MVHASLLLLIEDDLQQLGAVLLSAQALADDLDGVDEVGEDGVVDSGQGSGTWALLRLASARSVRAFGAGEDAACGEDQDVAVGELLLKLAGEAREFGGQTFPFNLGEEGEERHTVAAPCGSLEGMGRGQR